MLNQTGNSHESIIVLDFGSQYTQLIARRIREANVYCEILPFNTPAETIVSRKPKGIILSGGPASVYDKDAPKPSFNILEETDCPILGICYGLQVSASDLGGEVLPSNNREYGYERLFISEPESLIFKDLPGEMDVWMSHGDIVTKIPHGFRVTAHTEDALNAFEDLSGRIFGVQFHPEVAHTPFGGQILQNFLFRVCRLSADWSPRTIIAEQIKTIKSLVGDEKVICGLSGGVDSTVAATIVQEAIGERQTCIFVNTGLLREGEFETTCAWFKQKLSLNVIGINEEVKFLSALRGVTDPEEKRRVIGRLFIDAFEREAGAIGDVKFLVQGTLYPDVIESTSVRGPSAVIKSHHNVGGLPRNLKFKLVEPLRELFKDEVRAVGLALGLDEEFVHRQPFPGPGLAVRCLGPVDRARLDLLREADDVVVKEIKAAGLYRQVWQSFAVLLPVRSVGVVGDDGTYQYTVAA